MQENSFNLETQYQASLLVGFDFGTHTSCLLASYEGSKDILVKKMIPTVVGYPKNTVLEGILPENQNIFIGQEALRYSDQLDLVYPMKEGVIADKKASKEFVAHIHKLIDPSKKAYIKAVVGVPANIKEEDQAAMQEVLAPFFNHVRLIPEPFLAALGYRNEKRLNDPSYIDPGRSALFVDIGAGTTDLCIIQGYMPGPKELVSIKFAGNWLDDQIIERALELYPDLNLSSSKARAIKEMFSYLGPTKKGLLAKLIVNGKLQQLDFGTIIGQACEALGEKIMQGLLKIISTAHPDAVEHVLKNIILTGGGSRIEGLMEYLQFHLEKAGFENVAVQKVGEHYKGFVAIGAWKECSR